MYIYVQAQLAIHTWRNERKNRYFRLPGLFNSIYYSTFFLDMKKIVTLGLNIWKFIPDKQL